MYQLRTSPIEDTVCCVAKINGSQTLLIPFDPANTDYQEYLEWLAEGNEPLPADN